MRDKRKIRLLFLSSLIATLIFVYISITWLGPTLSRYIKREQDEIRAYYTSLYFDSTGKGKTIALENNVGYVEFDLRNYIGEDVTQRDIVYSIYKPTEFYDASGNVISDIPTYLSNSENKLHVLDGWGEPQVVKNSTYLYDVEVVKNDGEMVSEGIYTFTYEKLGTSAKGKSHNLTCKVSLPVGQAPENDEISIVVQLTKPYKEVFIINMRVSDKLITFSKETPNIFGVDFEKIYVQSADLYAYYKNDTEGDDGINKPYDDTNRNTSADDAETYYQYTSYAFKLTFYWKGYILDEGKLEKLHIGTSTAPGVDKNYDAVDASGNPNNIGSIPNPHVNSPYVDIDKATIARINSVFDITSGHRGEMVIFVPQGSDFSLHFLQSSISDCSIKVKIEVYVTEVVNKVLGSSSYQIYDAETFGGYVHTFEEGEYLVDLLSTLK